MEHSWLVARTYGQKDPGRFNLKEVGTVEVLMEEELEVVGGGNAQDTVTGSFASSVSVTCYTTPLEQDGRTLKLCFVVYQ